MPDKNEADEAIQVLGVKSMTEAVHTALREIVALGTFRNLMAKHAGKLSFEGYGDKTFQLRSPADYIQPGRF
jgi:Arc/MetJ family transcription regulator